MGYIDKHGKRSGKSTFGWNLPPGVKTSDIPGNRPEDVAFERMVEELMDVLEEEHGTVTNALIDLWEEGEVLHGPDDGVVDTWEDLAVWLANEHEWVVEAILGLDEDHRDDDLRDIRKDRQATEEAP